MYKQSRLSFALLLIFFFNLFFPTYLLAQQKERWDEKMLVTLADKVEHLLQQVCTRLSAEEGNDVKVSSFFVDKDERIFAQIDGEVTLSFPIQKERWQKKLKEAAGSWISTNGSLATDISIKNVKQLDDESCLVSFSLDAVIQSKQVVKKLISTCTSIIGSASVGVVLSKLVAYVGSIDGKVVGKAIGAGFKKLWALGSGKTAATAYASLDQGGHNKVKAFLLKEVSVKSVLYHFGVFILKAVTKTGSIIARTSFGTAIATALSSQAAVAIGSAIAMAATYLIGKIVVKKLTKNLPLWWRLRRMEKLHPQAIAGDDSALEKITATEEAVLRVIDDELRNGKFKVLDMLTEKLGDAHKEKTLEPYEQLITGLTQKLQFATVQNEDWVMARKYYQLLHAIHRLPAEANN